ncbi:hypothetical protein AMTRI_Chr06g174730 [Amborella trichopoda]
MDVMAAIQQQLKPLGLGIASLSLSLLKPSQPTQRDGHLSLSSCCSSSASLSLCLYAAIEALELGHLSLFVEKPWPASHPTVAHFISKGREEKFIWNNFKGGAMLLFFVFFEKFVVKLLALLM